jgi:L-asparaginase
VQSISTHLLHPIIPVLVNLVHLNLRIGIVLAKNAGEKLLVHKKLDNNVVIVKFFRE